MFSALFLVAAVVLFILSAIPKISHGAMLPVGLACFAASFLIVRLT